MKSSYFEEWKYKMDVLTRPRSHHDHSTLTIGVSSATRITMIELELIEVHSKYLPSAAVI